MKKIKLGCCCLPLFLFTACQSTQPVKQSAQNQHIQVIQHDQAQVCNEAPIDPATLHHTFINKYQ